MKSTPTSAAEACEQFSRARDLHRRSIIVDGHCDTPYRLLRHKLDLSDHDPMAQLDLGMFRSSGITASFFVSYVPPFYADRGAASFAFKLFDVIDRQVSLHPDVLTAGRSVEDIRRAKREGTHAIMIGVEGGHAIEDSIATLDQFYDRGARYLTLTHVNTNNWADSSGDVARHGGLTDFGRDVVRRMNDLGMLVDISHVSDAAFYHALETSRVPIIASHSSCRALTRHPRNLTDQMLRDLAQKRGVCMINFFSAFINDDVAQVMAKAQKRLKEPLAPGESEELPDDRVDWDDYLEWFISLGCPQASIENAIDHIMHAVQVAGVEHVGIGSDFDGVPSLPEGLSDASFLPHVTEKLLERGLDERGVELILGENFLRVFEEVEQGAKRE